jgi:hypothetical protein
MDQATWDKMSAAQRDAVRDLSGLTPQLIGLEGARVEVVCSMTSEKRRFWVGRSTGWRPCHLEVLTRRSMGGSPAWGAPYTSVKIIKKDRRSK